MSTKTTLKRIALVAVSALGFGLMTAVAPASAATCADATAVRPVNAEETVFGNQSCASTSATTGRATIAVKQIAGSGNFVTLTFDTNASSSIDESVIVVSGGTIRTAPNATVTTDKTQASFVGGGADGDYVTIGTPTAGTVTAKYYERTIDRGVATDVLKQTFTITVVARLTVSTVTSTSLIREVGTAGATSGIWSSSTSTTADRVVYAPKGTCQAVTLTCDNVANVYITMKDANGVALSADTGTFPVVKAVVRGPGNVGWLDEGSVNAIGKSETLVNADKLNEATLYIFQDGTNGVSYIDIYLDGTLWTTEKMYFYGDAKTVSVAQNLYVAKTPTALTATTLGTCTTTCANDGASVATQSAATVTVKDDAGVAVPYATVTATSSDTTVFSSTVTSTMVSTAAGLGKYQVNLSTVPGTTSGKSAVMTFKVGTLVGDKTATYSIGGEIAKATLTVKASTEVGAAGTMTFTTLDAAGNKSYDADRSLTLSSNTAITGSIFGTDALLNQVPENMTLPVINGTSGALGFFNPLVSANVTLVGQIDALADVTASFAVVSSAVNAATAAANAAADAALEAIDAANAATDAANLAAEAADAATMAAQDAKDAADAATAAVEKLAQDVAALIADLKAQLATLANIIAKIAKKVKA